MVELEKVLAKEKFNRLGNPSRQQEELDKEKEIADEKEDRECVQNIAEIEERRSRQVFMKDGDVNDLNVG